MTSYIFPPGRTSHSQTGLVNPFGPHHCARCFGSVHALKTSSRGASNSRVMTNSFPTKFLPSVCAVIFLFSNEFSKFIEATSPALLVPVAAFGGRKFLVRQK